MSSEFRLTYQLSVVNGSFKDSFSPSQQVYDQSAVGYHSQVQTVGTSAEVMSTGDLTTPGICVMQNLDTTNFVLFGPDDSGTMKDCLKLKPGEINHFRLKPSTTYKLKADTAACKVLFKIYED